MPFVCQRRLCPHLALDLLSPQTDEVLPLFGQEAFFPQETHEFYPRPNRARIRKKREVCAKTNFYPDKIRASCAISVSYPPYRKLVLDFQFPYILFFLVSKSAAFSPQFCHFSPQWPGNEFSLLFQSCYSNPIFVSRKNCISLLTFFNVFLRSLNPPFAQTRVQKTSRTLQVRKKGLHYIAITRKNRKVEHTIGRSSVAS